MSHSCLSQCQSWESRSDRLFNGQIRLGPFRPFFFSFRPFSLSRLPTESRGGWFPYARTIQSIIFWLGRCVNGWEKTTSVIGWWTDRVVPNPPTWTDLNITNKYCLMLVCESAGWKPQSCDCQRLWHNSRSSRNIGTPTRWLLCHVIKAVHSTSSCSNCFVSRVRVTKETSQEHSRWRKMVRPKALERDADPFEAKETNGQQDKPWREPLGLSAAARELLLTVLFRKRSFFQFFFLQFL